MKHKKPSDTDRLIDEIRKLREELAKRPQVIYVTAPAPAPIIIKLPPTDDPPGAPVPWKPSPYTPPGTTPIYPTWVGTATASGTHGASVNAKVYSGSDINWNH